jgi:acetylornithine/N-succinyldiaminopimelate aminotransferase
VQGEGGVREAPADYLKLIRKLCNETGVLLIYDEIQCGAGRTGQIFHHQWLNGEADPDLLAAAKGIGGGFPMGMVLATKEAASGMAKGVHGTTFGGGPLAMAVGNAVLDVTGRGLLRGLRMKQDPMPLRAELAERGLLIGTAGNNVLRLAPPLIVTEDEVRQAIDIIDQQLASMITQPGD